MYNVNVSEHVIFIYICVYIYIHIHSSDHCAFIERVAMILMCLMAQATTSIAATLDAVLYGKLTVCYGKKRELAAVGVHFFPCSHYINHLY